MLEVIGTSDVSNLFADVPAALRHSATLNLAPGVSELELRARLEQLAAQNTAARQLCFMGAGAYPHFIPAVVDQILQRAEFYSAYTPYQPEVSQGTLQAIFEFQTLVSMLLGLEVANASMYDGASATAEAVLMALRLRGKRRRIVLSRALHPQYREVVRTYLRGAGEFEIVEAPFDDTGRTDPKWLSQNLDGDTAAVVIGYPNFFGIIEDLAAIGTLTHKVDSLLISSTTESVALGLLKPPGSLGADIAVAEGQSLGIPLSYGGPGVGLFATRNDFVRMMPGRLVGEAFDGEGRRGYVLTLATREQHIRRERATSNICTNQGLMALAFTVHVSLLGKQGIRTLAGVNVERAHRMAEGLRRRGWALPFPAPFFNEVVVRKPKAADAWRRARDLGVLPGVQIGQWYPELEDALLLCATEVHDDGALQALCDGLGD